MIREFIKDALVTVVMNPVVAGTSEQKSSVLDMAGYDGVLFIVSLGAVTDAAVITATAYENTASSTSSPTPTADTPAAGPVTASTSSNTILLVEVVRPAKRYVFLDILRTTQNVVINSVVAIQYRARTVPVTQPASVVATALVGPEA